LLSDLLILPLFLSPEFRSVYIGFVTLLIMSGLFFNISYMIRPKAASHAASEGVRRGWEEFSVLTEKLYLAVTLGETVDKVEEFALNSGGNLANAYP